MSDALPAHLAVRWWLVDAWSGDNSRNAGVTEYVLDSVWRLRLV